MAIKTFKSRLGPVEYNATPQRVDLIRGVNFHSLIGRVTATVDISGGTGSGTPVSEGVQRLIQAIRINHDGRDRIERLDGRQLSALLGYQRYTITPPVNLANGDAQTTEISFDFVIPIALPWIAKPEETAWPGNMPVRTQLAAWIEFLPAAQQSAALISGGDRTVAVSDLQVDLIQVYSIDPIPDGPWALTEIITSYTQQFSAANENLPLLIDNDTPITLAMLRALDDTAQDAADIINFLSIQSANGAINAYNRLPFVMLQREEAGSFPAVEEIGQTGKIGIVFTQNGMLSFALDPRDLNDPRFLFDVDAPSNPGVIQATYVTLRGLPGVTRK